VQRRLVACVLVTGVCRAEISQADRIYGLSLLWSEAKYDFAFMSERSFTPPIGFSAVALASAADRAVLQSGMWRNRLL
jgi:hypothetical protein